MSTEYRPGTVAGYTRKSHVQAGSPGDVSRDVQEHAIKALASLVTGQDAPVTFFSDWDISGRRGHLRPAYEDLKAGIVAGRFTVVLAYNLSRLGRNTRELLSLVDLCRDHGVVLRTAHGGIDTADATGRMFLTIMAAIGEWQAETDAEKATDNLASRRASGASIGMPGYGERHERVDGKVVRVADPNRPIQPLLDAYEATNHNVLQACKRLDEQGIRPFRAKTDNWQPQALTRILERVGARPKPVKGQHRSPIGVVKSPLAKLVHCPCGTLLTPSRQAGRPVLYCRNHGKVVNGFGPKGHAYRAEHKVLDLVWPQVDAYNASVLTLDAPVISRQAQQGLRDKEVAIEAARVAGIITDTEAATKVAAARAEVESQTEAIIGMKARPILRDKDPELVQKAFAARILRIDLDATFTPTIIWRTGVVPYTPRSAR